MNMTSRTHRKQKQKKYRPSRGESWMYSQEISLSNLSDERQGMGMLFRCLRSPRIEELVF